MKKENANKDSRSFSALRGAAAVEIQLKLQKAKLDGGG